MATKKRTPETLVGRLVSLEGRPLGDKEYRVRYYPDGADDPVYLMGTPHVYTSDVRRAFVFATRDDALRVIDDFQKLFNSSACVVESERTER